MIFDAAIAALNRLFTAEFRAVFFKTLGLTVVVLIGLWFGVTGLFEAFALPPLQEMLPGLPQWASWLGIFAAIFAGLALALGLGLLIAPVTAVIAGFFLDDVAELVERNDYPLDPPGRALPLMTAALVSAKFLVLVVLGNLLALLLLLIPGVNIAAFFVVNGYLLGREFFEFAAMRFRTEADAKALRRRNAGTVFLAGLVIAAFLSVPLLNLLTPLFAAAMMVHLHKMVSAREDGVPLKTAGYSR
ncbi:sulfate transporter family protein [Aquamicrobium sp. LC103]|uniref:sulfate transporter family protein n=1 Tax=Aquamicrobium sp. LC103 TaxID=1120658 RepID=UPI00063EC0FF|nr:sulfate transporter family protein [Aquamicrobium sp. LC103]TKT82653.1 sulfate transporter family protein [Aquamicrobium sp. LC103]